MNLKVVGLLFLLFSSCSKPLKFNKTSIAYLDEEKICIKLYSGKDDCLILKGKKVYISPYFEPIDMLVYLRTNNDHFQPLVDNFDAVNKFDSCSRKKLEADHFENLNFHLTNDSTKTQIKLSTTCFFELDGFEYCIIQVEEGTYKKWIIKLKVRNGKLVAKEIDCILD